MFLHVRSGPRHTASHGPPTISKRCPDCSGSGREKCEGCEPCRDCAGAAGTEDVAWIPEVAKRGWIILSKDVAVRRNEHEILSIARARARAFLLASDNLTGSEQVALFLKHIPEIERRASGERGPIIWRVTKEHVSVVSRSNDLKKLVIKAARDAKHEGEAARA